MYMYVYAHTYRHIYGLMKINIVAKVTPLIFPKQFHRLGISIQNY